MLSQIEALAEIREVFRRRVKFAVQFAAENRNSEIHLLCAISKLIEDPLDPFVQEALVYYGFMLYENVKEKVPVEGAEWFENNLIINCMAVGASVLADVALMMRDE
jgi:hypothetical protein